MRLSLMIFINFIVSQQLWSGEFVEVTLLLSGAIADKIKKRSGAVMGRPRLPFLHYSIQGATTLNQGTNKLPIVHYSFVTGSQLTGKDEKRTLAQKCHVKSIFSPGSYLHNKSLI